MYRDRVLEEKKRLNLSAKSISDASKLHLTEETISRFLSGKTQIGVDNFIDIVETMGMKPYEAFMDATEAAEFRVFRELKSKGDETEAERIKLIADNEALNATNAGLTDKIRVLELEKAKTNVEIEAMKELLRVYRHFTNTKD